MVYFWWGCRGNLKKIIWISQAALVSCESPVHCLQQKWDQSKVTGDMPSTLPRVRHAPRNLDWSHKWRLFVYSMLIKLKQTSPPPPPPHLPPHPPPRAYPWPFDFSDFQQPNSPSPGPKTCSNAPHVKSNGWWNFLRNIVRSTGHAKHKNAVLTFTFLTFHGMIKCPTPHGLPLKCPTPIGSWGWMAPLPQERERCQVPGVCQRLTQKIFL